MTGRHETRDIRSRPIVLAGATVLGTVAVVSALLFVLVRHYARREARASAPNPLAASYGRREPPAPRLQNDPRRDLEALHASEDAQLHGYAWVDRAGGRVRIPIERAMEVLVQHGGAP